MLSEPGSARTFLAIKYKPSALNLVISRSNPVIPSLTPFVQVMVFTALLTNCEVCVPGLFITKNAEVEVICHIQAAQTTVHIEERLRIGRILKKKMDWVRTLKD